MNRLKAAIARLGERGSPSTEKHAKVSKDGLSVTVDPEGVFITNYSSIGLHGVSIRVQPERVCTMLDLLAEAMDGYDKAGGKW